MNMVTARFIGGPADGDERKIEVPPPLRLEVLLPPEPVTRYWLEDEQITDHSKPIELPTATYHLQKSPNWQSGLAVYKTS